MLEAGRSLLIERERTLALADEAGIFILGHVAVDMDAGHG